MVTDNRQLLLKVPNKTSTISLQTRLKHSLAKRHKEFSLDNVTIISKNYKNYYKEEEVSEALFLKTKKPILNTQDNFVPLKLFNYRITSIKRILLLNASLE